jgi:hypothetical protein
MAIRNVCTGFCTFMSTLALAFGCAGGSDEEGEVARFDPLKECEGTYLCSMKFSPEPYFAELELDTEGCTLSGMPFEGPGVTFEGTSEEFTLCDDPYCRRCSFVGSESSGSCQGQASSCSGFSSTSCSEQYGCSLSLGATLSTSDDRCTGSPEPCKELYGVALCAGQSGCQWR